MSLILDALKKSEQERRRDKGPDLQTIHQPPLPRAQRRSYAVLLGFLLIAVNAAIVGYWWQQRVTPTIASAVLVQPPPSSLSSTTAALATPTSSASAPATIPKPVEPPASTPIPTPVAATVPEYTSITPASSTAAAVPAASSTRIEEVDELPEDVRNNLPAMTFSFHVYSSNPQQRTIIINNRRMREGDDIGAGLLLQEITEDGVILQYAQHRVHISVLSGW